MSAAAACPAYGDAGAAQGGGWTCPVCFFYCQRDWLVCPVCDYVRPPDLPMDDDHPAAFCIVRAARGATG